MSSDELYDEPEFVGDELPPRGSFGGSWLMRLTPLLNAQRGWYLIRTCDTQEQAMAAQGNLTSRMIKIPDPTGNWRFASRGPNVYAYYEGPAIPAAPRIKRASANKRKRARQKRESA